MNIETKEPEKIKFITHEFVFLFGKGLTIDLYPSLGDTCVEQKTFWRFKIPRLNITNYEIYRTHCIGHEVTEGERVFTDTKEVMKQFMETRRRQRVEKERRDAEKAQSQN